MQSTEDESSDDKKILTGFLYQPAIDATPDAMPVDNMAVSAPEANVDEFRSGGVIDMLGNFEDEFKTKKADFEEEELKAACIHPGHAAVG